MNTFYGLGATALCAAIFTALSKPLAVALGTIDSPSPLKIHAGAVPRFGGFGIMCGLTVGVLFFAPRYDPLLIAFAAIWIVGAIDDRLVLTAWQKLGGQIIAALMLAMLIFRETSNATGIALGVAGAILATTFSNAVNLIDGMNGLAAGNAVIILIGFALLQGVHHLPTALSLIMAAAILGFLPFNFPKAGVFMGDSGSLLIGFVIAYSLATLLVGGVFLFVCGLIVALLPAYDLSLGLLRRLLSRRSLFSADRGHFYDRLDSHIKDSKLTVLITYAASITFAVIGVGVSYANVVVAMTALGVIACILLLLSASLGWLRLAGIEGSA